MLDGILDAGLAPADIERRFEETARVLKTPCFDGDLIWRVWGEGPPLVLLHGGYGSWRHWIKTIPVMMKSHTLYVADMPGLGDSATVPQPYDAYTIARPIAEGLDIILPPPARYDIAGFSFGGLIGGHVAELQGDRVKRYIAIAPGGLGVARTTERRPLAKMTRHMTDAERREAHRHNLSVIMFADDSKIDDLAIHLQSESTRRGRTKSPPIAQTDTLAKALPKVTAEIKAIYGRLDDATGTGLARREALFNEIRPGLDFRIIEDAGHWVMYETPDEFVGILRDMLAE
jgi:2-hydroxy-6-oxonona-2,4-dienedioate hydrolase